MPQIRAGRFVRAPDTGAFERYDHPQLTHFARKRVEIVRDPKLSAEQARVEAHMKDGTVLSAHRMASKGTPENPLSGAGIEEKFRRAARDRLSA